MTFKKLVEIAHTLKVASEGEETYQIPIEFYRRPRTKNRRIIKKWKKRIENWRVPAWFKLDRTKFMGQIYQPPKVIIENIIPRDLSA